MICRVIFCVIFCPTILFANGLVDRANSQYLRRDYTKIGMEQASAAQRTYGNVVKKLLNIEGEFARARMLQASHFLVLAGSSNKNFILQDGIGQAMQGYLYFERTYGRAPFENSSLSERGRKIYADLLYWKGMIFSEWIKSQGGGFQNELNKIKNDMQTLIAKGYGCLNDGGAYRILEQYQKAYECTLILDESSVDRGINWNGWNVLAWATYLAKSGQRPVALNILKKFIAVPAEKLAFDFVPENRRAQEEAALKLKEWGSARPTESVPGEYVLQFKSQELLQQQMTIMSTMDIKERIDQDIIVIRRPKIEREDYRLQQLQQIPGVLYAEPNYIYRLNRTSNNLPNDEHWGELWGFQNLGQIDSKGGMGLAGMDIDLLRAWEITTGHREVIVGVIDTGVDFSSPDLRDNAWVNEAELNGKPGVDDDGNGYIDDLHGFDFLNNKSEVIDDNGHGTHVAGVIGARGNNGFGIAGINWNIRIMSLKFLGAEGSGDLASALKAIRYATKMGAKITNNSWGTGLNSQILHDVILEAANAGSLFVAAAGNSGENADVLPEYPGGYDLPNVISVAAIDNRGRLSNFSNYGMNRVHIGAPGENILSTTPQGFESLSGTSMASPHVAGVAALLWGQEPSLSMTEVRQRILSTATPLATLREKTATGGIVNAYSALTHAPPKTDPYDPAKWESKVWRVSSDHHYKANQRREYEISVPDAIFVTVHFSKMKTEPNYDRVVFFDQKNNLVGVWSGEHTNEYAPIAEGNQIRILFLTDGSIQDEGFDIDQIMYKQGEPK
ncbi:MAG: S8 family serine peptidase [Bdellovibrionaceae bacterium]|nr:S8 family serine peptidase [Pseudobdellovibrionaceae bacterium]